MKWCRGDWAAAAELTQEAVSLADKLDKLRKEKNWR